MKSILFRMMLVVAAFAIVPASWAADDAGGGIFLDAKQGKTFGKGSSSTVGSQASWGVDGGYLWRVDDQRLAGFELGYQDFGKVSDFSGNFGSDQLSASALSLGGRFEYLFGDDRAWIFQLRGGLASVGFDEHLTRNFPSFSSSTDSTRKSGIYLGLGLGRELTQGFSVLLAYSHHSTIDNSNGGGETDLNLNWIGLVAEYRFGD